MGHVFCRKALKRASTKITGIDQDAFAVSETTSMRATPSTVQTDLPRTFKPAVSGTQKSRLSPNT